MKKLVLMAVAATFSLSAAAYACDGMKGAKGDKASQAAKKETKKEDRKS